MKIHLFNEHLYRAVSLNLVRTIFDNIYNLPLFISYYNFKSGIINPDGIGSPIMSDELRINKISMLVRVD